ncbi:MAG: transcription termination/antitermination protein NusA [Ruminococcaceae bacterium]|nr:transcription termination/antitermination protein NusA [Oscillospiraceae bacterium]
MNNEFFLALDILEKEKGIPKEYMIERVEAALLGAYKREEGGNSNVRIVIDCEKKDVRVYQQKTIVEEVTDPSTEISLEDAKKISRRYALGGTAEIEMKTKNFRRLSAQTAKQVIIQGIREAERSNLIKEYESKREEIITAQVIKIDQSNGNVILDTGTSTAVLTYAEQIPGERFEIGDRIKVFVTEVRRELRGPLVTLSRIHPGLVKRIFELEIPEIQDGTVVIKSVSREAGSRTKIAVASADENVDPVGACIGNRGMRIAAINDELRGERIDIIRYSDDPCEYVTQALSPAKVESVELDGERSCKVFVDADQLSLAIGKEGQNARLAAKLTGFKIDIKAK